MPRTVREEFAPVRLRCEYEACPLGMDERQPRLSWQISDPTVPRGARQTAYRILVASTEEALSRDRADLWDSGRVESSQSLFIDYGGPPPVSRRRYWWKVCFWNGDGRQSNWSAVHWWEMGLLEPEDYTARWIASSMVGGRDVGAAAPYMRKTFHLKSRPVQARLYITALGLYEASINGQRVGDLVFTPGWTDYAKRVMVQTYDVTDLLAAGDNVLGAILGDGWYCGHVGPLRRQFYGLRPMLLAQLEVTFPDGSRHVVQTDESWRTAAGPILLNDLLMGETYDARFELPGWNTPGYDDSEWQAVQLCCDVKVQLVGTLGPRVRHIQTLRPVSVSEPIPGRYVFDFGQNLVGRVSMRLRGKPGETAILRHAEMLNPDGTLYTANLRSAAATDRYTFADERLVEWEPRFTFPGFRFVELSGVRGETWNPDKLRLSALPDLDSLEAHVLHNDMPITGSFGCSHPLINQLQSNILWGQRGNFLEVPPDCPQRDERLGWTGDIQVFLTTACFNMDVQGFIAKWLIDLEDGQRENGAYTTVAPSVLGRAMDGTAAWADAGIIVPWILYRRYGDVRVLQRHYAGMARFMDYLRKQCGESLIRTGGFGDWLSVGAFTPLNVIGTAFFAHSADLMSRIAAVLGKKDDAAAYADLFQHIRTAFCREFVTSAGRIIGDSQTAYVLALRFNLLPKELRSAAMQHLVDDIEHGQSIVWPYSPRQGSISTGFIGCKHINLALSEGGRTDVAYRLITHENYPSWLYPVKNGATTIWERWDGWTPQHGFQNPQMNSFNHYAFGAVGEWMYAVMAGLDFDESAPGGRRLRLCPQPGGGITHAAAGLDTPYGHAACRWELTGEQLTINLVVPPNATALVRIPADPAHPVTEGGRPLTGAEGLDCVRTDGQAVWCEVVAGTYRFVSKMPLPAENEGTPS